MRRFMWVVLFMVLGFAASAGAQTTTSTVTTTSTSSSSTSTSTLPTFPTLSQTKSVNWGEYDVMTAQSCPNSLTCETGMFSIAASVNAELWVSITGTGQVKIVCRIPNFPDFVIADSTALTDSSTKVAITPPCHYAVAQLTGCSGTCKARAHVTVLGGAW